MKYALLVMFYLLTFVANSNDDKTAINGINVMTSAMACFNTIPDDAINNPDFKVEKVLSLATSVIEHITVEMGTNNSEQKEFRPLFKVAYRYCATEIDQLKREAPAPISN